MRAIHHNAAVHAPAKQRIRPEEWGLHPEVMSQIYESFGKAFTNAKSTYYLLWFALHGQPHCLNVYAVHYSTMDGISLWLINVLQSFWKDQGDFVQEVFRKRWLYRVHNVMYPNKTPRNVGGITGPHYHRSSTTGIGSVLWFGFGLWKPEYVSFQANRCGEYFLVCTPLLCFLTIFCRY